MTMTRGDAFPFESVAVVQPDGWYTFPGVPAGKYAFSAASTGWSYDIDGDIAEMGVQIRWDVQGTSSRTGEALIQLNEMSVLFDLETLHRGEASYADLYKKGFSSNLNHLGPPPKWYRLTAERAGLVDERLAGLLTGGNETEVIQSGYRLTYAPGVLDGDGKITTYSVVARPVEFGKSGRRSFYLDEAGIVHEVEADRPATREDTAIKKRP